MPDSVRRVRTSTIQRNSTEEWATITNGDPTSHDGALFGSVAESVSTSVRRIAISADTMADRTKSAVARADQLAHSVGFAERDFQDIRIIANSVLDHTDFLAATAAEMSRDVAEGMDALKRIDQHLKEHNDYVASGCMSLDGFALHVHDFVNQQVEVTKTTTDGQAVEHIFFLYNPGTVWWPAFQRLTRKTPLPTEFSAKSHDLDKLCRLMLAIRKQKPHHILHLLIPTIPIIQFKEPLHFPDELQPFQVEAELDSHGNPLVEFNLPRASPGLLHGPVNVRDPKTCGLGDGAAELVAGVTTAAATGWLVNGVCLTAALGVGTLTGLGAVIAMPLWVGCSMFSLPVVAEKIRPAIYDGLRDKPPRILGSNENLQPTEDG